MQRRRWNFLKKRFKFWHENRVNISHDVKVVYPENISMDSRAFVGHHCLLDARAEITIGKDVQIAFHTFMLTSNHKFDNIEIPIDDQPMEYAPITIRNDVWIGCRCMILPGVTIGDHAIVAAHTVLAKSVPPWAIEQSRLRRNVEHSTSNSEHRINRKYKFLLGK